ncbi:hypothetical protein FOCC_FOCC016155 [Frankliniella occidentalis]|nr:hypothetical protein FOCC_FOCC016155 [Frankliniella occidentalis]
MARHSAVRYSDEINDKLIKWMNETGYNIVQINGQRISTSPRIDRRPGRGCEVFVGKIPRDCYEDELFPVFQRIGHIHELRLMMMFSGTNRGYAFVMYERLQDAQRAVQQLDSYEIRRGHRIGVLPCVNNCRLFVLRSETEHVVSVKKREGRNDRWYLLVEYMNHRAAAIARRELTPRRSQLFGPRVIVDWEIQLDKHGRKLALEQRRAVKPSTTAAYDCLWFAKGVVGLPGLTSSTSVCLWLAEGVTASGLLRRCWDFSRLTPLQIASGCFLLAVEAFGSPSLFASSLDSVKYLSVPILPDFALLCRSSTLFSSEWWLLSSGSRLLFRLLELELLEPPGSTAVFSDCKLQRGVLEGRSSGGGMMTCVSLEDEDEILDSGSSSAGPDATKSLPSWSSGWRVVVRDRPLEARPPESKAEPFPESGRSDSYLLPEAVFTLELPPKNKV